jgi:hypothetical protein
MEARASHKCGAPRHSESHINMCIYLINTFKNQIFYHMNSANEYQWKAKNNKSAIRLNGIPTFLLIYYSFLNKLLSGTPWADGPGPLYIWAW